MHFFRLTCSQENKDRIVAELWERGTQGIVEQDLAGGGCELKAFFEPVQPELAQAYDSVWELQADQDWVALSQAQWEPLPVGERFFLVPVWRSDPTPPGRIRLEIEPGQACGTGWHAATRLCLRAMERYVAPGASFLDVGCGSGILSEAAALLGAGSIAACDIDPVAAEAAAQRLPGRVFVGSVRSIRPGSVELAVANINAAAVTQMAAGLERVVRPGGKLIVGGFQSRQLPAVERAFPGRPRMELFQEEDWVALVY